MGLQFQLQEMALMEIAVIGLGAIGSLLAMHLIKANHKVTVWNRSTGPARQLAGKGARSADTMADAFQSDIVISVLFDDDAVRERLLDDELLSRARPGALHICMSTISPELATELEVACRHHGLRYVSAPLFGRPDAAASAQLQILVAGETEAARQAHEILRLFGQTWPMGAEPRHANLAKLAGNFMMGCAIEAMAECSALLSANGADDAAFLDIMARTLFSSPTYRSFAPSVASVRPLPASGLDIPLKDMGLALAAARRSKVELAFIGVLLERLNAARASGFGADDWSAALGKLARKGAA
jgi:3-hydroxyisobutyrate dehydrogenase-like beta-hydroxyacid dehydrogenase